MEGKSTMSVMGEWLVGTIFGSMIGVLMGVACSYSKAIVTVISVFFTGEKLGVKVIAEYVETEEQRDKLKELGVSGIRAICIVSR